MSAARKKLYEEFPLHEGSSDHIQKYIYNIQWRNQETRIKEHSTINMLLCDQITSKAKNCREILKHILDNVLFLNEGGLALIGQPKNGNFLGILK